MLFDTERCSPYNREKYYGDYILYTPISLNCLFRYTNLNQGVKGKYIF